MDGNGGPFSTLRGKQEHSTIHVTSDGFLFLLYKQTDSARYYRCNQHRSCTVRATYYNSTGTINFSGGQHSHSPQHGEIAYRTARLSLIEEARRLDVASLQDIFNNPSRLLTDQLTYHRLQPSMARARTQVLPKCETFAELIAALNNPAYSCITAMEQFEDVLFQGSSQAQDTSLVALFMSRKSAHFLSIVPSVFLFLISVPIGDQELKVCTVGARWNNCVLPLAWCVMEAETHAALFAAFLLLRTSLVSWQFCKATCGEVLVSHAFHSAFNCPVNPTLYHYIQDVKQCLKNSTMHHILESSQLRHIVLLCCALPILPTDLIQLGLNVVFAEANIHGVASESGHFFRFIEEHWLRNGHQNFSVCGSSERTDYGSEELKSVILGKLMQGNANMYCLTKFMVSTTREVHKDIDAALQGIRRRVRIFRAPMSEEAEICELVQQLAHPNFSMEFAVRNILVVTGKKIAHLVLL